MGRLFWKFFAFVWLAQLCGGLAIGLSFWMSGGHFGTTVPDIDAGPAAGLHVSAGSAILQFAGVDAFKTWAVRPSRDAVLAVDDANVELLGRTVAAQVIAHARELHALRPDSPQVADVLTPDHRRLLLFAEAQGPDENRRASEGLSSSEGPRPSGDGQGFGLGPPGGPPSGGMQPGRMPPGSISNAGLWGRHLIPGLPPLGPMVFTFLVSLLTASLLAWYVAKPIRSLRAAFASAAAGNLGMRVVPLIGSRHDELADLGQDFDRMAERLQAAMAAQRRLLHDVSHEVRSPLARLQVAVGLMRRKAEAPNPAIERIEEEIERIDRLVGDLLRLSRLEAGESGESEQDIDLHELILEIVTDANFEAEACGREVVWEPQVEARLRGRVEILHVAIENVVRNALKHAPDSHAIRVETHLDAQVKHYILRVLDCGPGVPEAELPTLFTPFFRSAQAVRVDGYGLGLAIARRSVESHGGVISASNRPEGGLMVEIVLPLKR